MNLIQWIFLEREVASREKTIFPKQKRLCQIDNIHLVIPYIYYCIFLLSYVIIRTVRNFYLQYDEFLHVLRVEWRQESSIQQLRPSAEQLLALLQTLSVRHLLIDMNSVPDLPVDDELWLSTHWMPGLVALPLARLVLVIDGNQLHNQLAIDALYNVVQPAIRFDSQYFSDTNSAMGWLTDDSDRLPALAAEWNTRHSVV